MPIRRCACCAQPAFPSPSPRRWQRDAIAAAVLRPHVPGARTGRRGAARSGADARCVVPHVARGAAIVGLEPSCLLTLRDEFLVLGLGDARATLASRAMLIEEFLVARAGGRRSTLPLDALPERRALVHGHCHQKAFDVAGARRHGAALDSRPRRRNDRVELLRHGRRIRLRRRPLRRVDADGRAVAAAGRAHRPCRHADRRRRHELPAPDRRRDAQRPSPRRRARRSACSRVRCRRRHVDGATHDGRASRHDQGAERRAAGG